MSKKVDNKKETKETVENPTKTTSHENFNKYSKKQHELIDYMKNNDFNVTVFGAPQSYIAKVSKRDPDISHTSAYDKLSYVEDFLKNHQVEAKKEYAEEEKIVEENKKNKPRKPKEHRCNCQFCTHKTLKKPHKCNCKYCTISKKDDAQESTEEETEETKTTKTKPKTSTKDKPKTVKGATKPKETKPKAPAKGKGKTKAAEQEEVVEETDS